MNKNYLDSAPNLLPAQNRTAAPPPPQLAHRPLANPPHSATENTTENATFPALAPAAYAGTDQQSYAELRELAELVGISLAFAGELTANPPIAVLNFTSENCREKCVRASFHPNFAPYFASGSVELNLAQDAAEILELFAAVGATTRGQVLGVIGAQGGIGTSTTALWIARELARSSQSVVILDLDPVSAGIDLIISSVNSPGKRWSDIRGKGALLATRLASTLPTWKNVRFLSADSRGGVDLQFDTGEKAIAALAQVHDWTVLDLPTRALSASDITHKWLEWCDALLLVSGVSELNLATTQAKISQLSTHPNLAVIARGAKSKGQLADISQQLGMNTIFPLRHQSTLANDLSHGLTPGDRTRSGSCRDIRVICAALQEGAQINSADENPR